MLPFTVGCTWYHLCSVCQKTIHVGCLVPSYSISLACYGKTKIFVGHTWTSAKLTHPKISKFVKQFKLKVHNDNIQLGIIPKHKLISNKTDFFLSCLSEKSSQVIEESSMVLLISNNLQLYLFSY